MQFQESHSVLPAVFSFLYTGTGRLGIQNWQTEDQKNQRTVRCLLFLAQKYDFLSLGIRMRQWHANSVYQPVAGVQIVGTSQKDVSRKNSERVTSFLPFLTLALLLHAALHYLNACGTFYEHFLQ